MEKERLPEKREREEVIYYQEDEIDLYELWLTLKKRWKVVLSTTALFVLASVVYILVAKPVYEAKAIIKLPAYYEKNNETIKKVPFITSKETELLIEKLNQLIEQKELTIISKKLNIPVNISKYITKIYTNNDRKNRDIILIKVEYSGKNPKFEQQIFPAVVKYLNSNPYLSEKINLKRETLKKLISTVNQKLKELISMKSLILKKLPKSSKNNVFTFNSFSIDREILSLQLQLNEFQYKLENLKGFEISVEPIFHKNPAKPKKSLILAVATVSSLFLGVFLAFFLEWIENARKRHTQTY